MSRPSFNSFDSPPPKKDLFTERCEKLKSTAQKLGSAVRLLNEGNGIDDLLNGPICVGEVHSHETPKRWFLQNLEKLKEAGFDVLFMEHLSPDSKYSYETSEVLDSEGRLLEGSPLKAKLHELDGGHLGDVCRNYNGSNGFSHVVEKALGLGIKIIPLELSDAAYSAGRGGTARMAELNANALEIISAEERRFFEENGRPLKWVAFVGSGHLHEHEDVPGICDVVSGVTSVFVADAIEGKEVFRVFKEPTETISEITNVAKKINFGEEEGVQEFSELVDRSAFEPKKSGVKALVIISANAGRDLSFDALRGLMTYSFSEEKLWDYLNTSSGEINSVVEGDFYSPRWNDSETGKRKLLEAGASKKEEGLFGDEDLQSFSPAPVSRKYKSSEERPANAVSATAASASVSNERKSEGK